MAVNLLINLEELGLTPSVCWHYWPVTAGPVCLPPACAGTGPPGSCPERCPLRSQLPRQRGLQDGGGGEGGTAGRRAGRGSEGALTAGRLPRLPPPYARPVGVPTQVRQCRGPVTCRLHTYKVWILGRNHPPSVRRPQHPRASVTPDSSEDLGVVNPRR